MTIGTWQKQVAEVPTDINTTFQLLLDEAANPSHGYVFGWGSRAAVGIKGILKPNQICATLCGSGMWETDGNSKLSSSFCSSESKDMMWLHAGCMILDVVWTYIAGPTRFDHMMKYQRHHIFESGWDVGLSWVIKFIKAGCQDAHFNLQDVTTRDRQRHSGSWMVYGASGWSKVLRCLCSPEDDTCWWV